MSDMHEAVVLPDPAVKRLLHPIDLPEARPLYLRGWWFARLCSLPVVVAIAAVVWTLSGNLLASLVAPATSFAIGFAASRWFEARSWDFIPRKRQDPDGAGRWRLVAAALDAAALLVTAGAVVVAMQRTPPPDGMVAFAVGSALGVVVVQAVELAGVVRRSQPGIEVAQRVILLVAVLTAAVVVAVIGSSGVWSAQVYLLAAAGMGAVLLAQGLWWLSSRSRTRRAGEVE